MALDSHDGYGSRDRELMGVHGDVLFADPLGLRAGSQKSQSSTAPQRNDPFSASRQHEDGLLEPQREDEEEEEEQAWGPIGSFFWYMVAGGKQCCSMRDRTKPQDVEAAKKAAETGRPPHSRFPDPPKQGILDTTFGRPEVREPQPFGADRGFRASEQQPSKPKPFADRQQDNSDSESDSEPYRPRPGSKGPDVSSLSGWKPSHNDASRSQSMDAGGGGTRPPLFQGSPSGGGGGGPPPQDPAGAAGAPGQSPKRWEWPPWCLNFKSPCIEVYVVDDETGVGRWVEAEPQSRVVDKAGRDAYLCVEYEWDGDYYVQDFGPQHVRRRGQTTTVFQMFEKAADDSVRPASRTYDTGGGISAFLGD